MRLRLRRPTRVEAPEKCVTTSALTQMQSPTKTVYDCEVYGQATPSYYSISIKLKSLMQLYRFWMVDKIYCILVNIVQVVSGLITPFTEMAYAYTTRLKGPTKVVRIYDAMEIATSMSIVKVYI